MRHNTSHSCILAIVAAASLASTVTSQTSWTAGYTSSNPTFGNSTAVLNNGNLVIGDPGYTNSSNNIVGRVGIYTPGFATPLQTFDGSAHSSGRGSWVGQIGDVNADGTDDWAMSEPGQNRVYVHSGKTPFGAAYAGWLSPPTVSGVTFTGFGHRVISVGDLNNDTFDDIAIACNASSQGPGSVFIFTSQSALSSTFAYRVTLGNPSGASHQSNQFGHDIAYDEATKKLLVGAPYYTTQSNHPAQGAVVEYTLGATSASAPTVRQLASPGNLDRFGYGVAFLNDFDNDNKPEWTSGAHYRWNSGPSTLGQVAVFQTATSSFSTYAAANAIQSQIGAHMRSVEDLDADGARDIVAGDIAGGLHFISGKPVNGVHALIATKTGYRLAPFSTGDNLINTGGWGGSSLIAAKSVPPSQPAAAEMIFVAGNMNRGGGCSTSGIAPIVGGTRPLENTVMQIVVDSSNPLHANQAGILEIGTTNPLPYQALAWPFCNGSYYTNGGVQTLFTTDSNGRYPQNVSIPGSLLGVSVPAQAVVNNSQAGQPDATNVIFVTVGNT